MKTFNILTIFPEMFTSPFSQGVLSKAADAGFFTLNPVDIRSYTTDKHRITDDYQYGGGQGLVMKPEPIVTAVRDLKQKDGDTHVILMDPRGKKFTQKDAERLREYDSLTFICGRYEGVDERVVGLCVDESLSLGDFVLTGGEFASMVMIDSIARLLPGVLGDENSPLEDSHTSGMLEYPHYTRPYEFEGQSVPEILLSGHHAEIEKWRRQKSIEITAKNRPDMLKNADLSAEDKKYLDTIALKKKIYVALLHYPMKDKEKTNVATSITNMDLHDISRTCTTFDVKKYFVVTPLQAQREIASRVIDHWLKGYGATYNVNRKEAFERTKLAEGLLDVISEIEKLEGERPVVIATTARDSRANIGFEETARLAEEKPCLIIFGTGWGFTEDVFKMSDRVLKPIKGVGPFNHLSVRSAVAIILDRIHSF
ncbi:tRNA (guanosine(37)-N1)-methyltransferase TrmD [Seleniivibrio woodruffii]|uniref:tRNA (guanosine(37)-N1)-methyltransferase TrmD n=1 Tax=Seleniivibrio woodruffii TaxID=1078050 RepID=UPI0026ED6C79|nr:tRNA (guanosine(37)-N1)-methyltransferase TrmD [Seleniivibrio woodruffii]